MINSEKCRAYASQSKMAAAQCDVSPERVETLKALARKWEAIADDIDGKRRSYLAREIDREQTARPHRKTILTIDDDESVRSTIRIILGHHNIDAVSASDGEEALAKLALATFDLIIVDLFMPRMDGLETIMALHRLAPATPILAISGSIDWAGAPLPDLLKAALAFGAASCLKKPFRPDDLMAAVGQLMAGPR